MEPGEPLFKLIPLGVPVEAEVEVAGKDIARLHEATESEIESGEFPDGSEVRVKLDSFPFQKHGTLRGVVRKISEDSFEKESECWCTNDDVQGSCATSGTHYDG